MNDKYRLLVYAKNVDSVTQYHPYSGQTIPEVDMIDFFIGINIENEIEVGKDRMLVEFDEKIQVSAILDIYDPGIWLKSTINDINTHNKSVKVNQGRKKRNSIPIPPDMVIDPILWDFIIAAILLGKYPLFTGPTGSGKTQLAECIAKALGYNFYAINCGALLKPKSTLVGTIKAENGSTFIVEAEFLTHFQSDVPTIIFLDEISRIPSQAANYLMTITDRKQSYVYVEELAKRIYKGKNVIFIAAANFGMQYVDTRKMDNALMNRFLPYHLNYLKQDDEINLIMSRIKDLNRQDVKKLVECGNILRANYDSLGQEVSHRHMLDFAEFYTMGFTFGEIVNNLLINLFVNGNDDRREQVQQILNGKL